MTYGPSPPASTLNPLTFALNGMTAFDALSGIVSDVERRPNGWMISEDRTLSKLFPDMLSIA